MIPEAAVAWLLAEAAAPCLTGYQRTMAFVDIGSGEALLAIERILTVVAHARFTLPATTAARLDRWLECYADGPKEQQLRKLLAGIQTEPLSGYPPTPSTPKSVQITDINPQVIARHSPPITCPVSQVAASIRDWFPNAGAAVHDIIDALQHALCAGEYVDQLAGLLHLVVEPVAD